MKKLIFSLSLFLSFSSLVQAQIDATINTTAIGLGATSTSTNYKFTYQNNSIPHYGVSWFVDQDQTGGAPMGYLSGFAGLKFFTGGSVKMLIHNNGNVGIGTTTPSSKLSLGISTGNKKLFIYDSGTEASGFGQALFEFRIFGAASSTNHISFGKYDLTSDSFSEQMRLDNTGNLSIGTTDSKGYKFAVNGSTIATSVTVKSAANWPDYVFKKDYKLPSLQEVKAYIDQNQHLPEIPSEQQIAKEGLDLGEMNKLLMKKVEELTLYLIEKDKEVREQRTDIDKLKEQVQSLLKKIE